MNKHAFTTVKDEESRGFVSRIINSHGFVSSIVLKAIHNMPTPGMKIFPSIVDGFHVTPTLIGKFDSNLRIVVSTIKSSVKIGAAIVINPIIIVVDYTKAQLTLKPVITIMSNLSLLPIFKMFKKMGTASIILANIITIGLKSLENIITNILNISSVAITGTMTCKKYYKVYEWDSWLLSDLDSKTLWEMDYQVV